MSNVFQLFEHEIIQYSPDDPQIIMKIAISNIPAAQRFLICSALLGEALLVPLAGIELLSKHLKNYRKN